MNLIVKGNTEILGKQIQVIEGGFGEGKKVLTDKTISEIHETKAIEIRRLIKDNMKRFKDGVDIIDLKGMGNAHTLEKYGYSKQAITQADNLFLLSERGYAKIIKIMDSDKAWEVHDILMDEYFNMRESQSMASTGNKEADLYTQLMQASMQAISHVLNQNMVSIKQDIKEEFNKERESLKGIITEQEIVHSNQLQEARNLIGFKTKNTCSLTKLLKARISMLKGYKIKADDYHYIIAKEKIFRKYVVWTWEEMPVHKYDEVHADIDSIDDLDDISFI